MSDDGDFLGAAVVDGEMRFFSPSSLDKGNPRAGGCPLKWWYRYVRRIKEADTDSKDAGRKLHDELARYQRTGDRNLSALACSGLHMVPTGPDLIVEQPIHQVQSGLKISSLLTADGVPVVGWVDHANRRGLNMGGEDITDVQDPPGTVEIIDWKWKKDGSKSEYFLTRDQLVLDTQLSGYGFAIGRYFGAQHVRLGHGYFPATRGRPRKVTKLHVLQDCADNWKYVEGVARHLRCLARESNPERIEGNRNACGSYGGCPYRGECPTYKQQSSSEIFGETASKDLTMALNFVQQPAAPAPDAATAALNAEELKLRMQAAQQQVMPGFGEALGRIQMSGKGFPPLAGAAAQMYAAFGGQSIAPGSTFPGMGELARMPVAISDPLHVLQLANELVPMQQPQATGQPASMQPPAAQLATTTMPTALTTAAPTASGMAPWLTQSVGAGALPILPPDAPQSMPHLAAKPVEGFAMPQPPAFVPTNTTQAAMPPMTFQFPPAQQSQGPIVPPTIQAAPVPPSSAGATVSPAAPAAEAPKKPGRKPKAPGVPGARADLGSTAPGIDSPSPAYQVFVDCIPNIEAEPLAPYIDGIVSELVSRFCAPPCLPDLRCAPKDGPLGFGGWRGALRAIVLEKPPAAGTYTLRARGDEIAEEVAAAMLTVCNKAGGLYVR